MKDDNFFEEIEAENKRNKNRKSLPKNPQMPVNLVKENKKTAYSVYDKIAENRKKAKLSQPKENTMFDQSAATEKETEKFIEEIVKNAKEDVDSEQEYYTREDIIGMCEFYRKKYNRRMWAVIFISLFFLCLIVVGGYLYLEGYLTEFIMNLY